MPGRAGRAAECVERAAVEQEAVRVVVVVRVQPEAEASPGTLAEDVPPLAGGVPVGLEVAVRRVVARPDVVLADSGRCVAVGVERGQRRVRDRARDRPVAAVGLEAGVVERRADLGRRDLPAEDRRALVVAGELDRPVADLGEPSKHCTNPYGIPSALPADVADAEMRSRMLNRMMPRLPAGIRGVLANAEGAVFARIAVPAAAPAVAAAAPRNCFRLRPLTSPSINFPSFRPLGD